MGLFGNDQEQNARLDALDELNEALDEAEQRNTN